MLMHRMLFPIWLGLSVGVLVARAEPPASRVIPSDEPAWPQFRGPARNGICRETGLLKAWPEGGPPLVWKRENIGRGYSSPVIAGDTLYITGDAGDDLVIFALNLDGTPKWQTVNGRSCLARSLGVLRSRDWVCIDLATGKTLSSHPDLVMGAALLADGRLYALAENGTVALLKPAPGGFETVGRFQLPPPRPGAGRQRDVWAHPVIHHGRLYLRNHDILYCYDIRERAVNP